MLKMAREHLTLWQSKWVVLSKSKMDFHIESSSALFWLLHDTKNE